MKVGFLHYPNGVGWRILANNGKELARSTEKYSRAGNAQRAAKKFVHACNTGSVKLETKK